MRFSRLCGVGVALIDVKLLNDPQSNKYFIGRMPIEDDSSLIPNFDSLKLKRIAGAHDIEKDSYGVVVSIVNTTLDVQVLHRWIGTCSLHLRFSDNDLLNSNLIFPSL